MITLISQDIEPFGVISKLVKSFYDMWISGLAHRQSGSFSVEVMKSKSVITSIKNQM
ncbi:hypothetical protein JOD96_001212 [Flavobacterium sp. 1355]|nr:hypothetical protein [Flavobacterium sp. 1355]